MSEPPQPVLTVRQTAAYLDVNEKTVHRLVQCGDLGCRIVARKQAACGSVVPRPTTTRKVHGTRENCTSATTGGPR